jgi:Flp pilus assembly protein TadG
LVINNKPLRDGKPGSRRGAAAVETALVILPVVMFLCGVFEYGRLLMVWNVLNNAAREGCRYALVNNTASTIVTDVQNVVTTRMAGQTAAFKSGTFTVSVSGTHAGASTAVNNLLPGDFITVSVTGQYSFMNIIPVVPMPSSFSITSSVTMLCEGGT